MNTAAMATDRRRGLDAVPARGTAVPPRAGGGTAKRSRPLTLVFECGKYSEKPQWAAGALWEPQISAFESMRIYDGVIFKLEEHIARLKESVQSVALKCSSDRKVWKQACAKAARESEMNSAFLRITVTAKKFWVTLSPLKLPRATAYKKGICLKTSVIRKGHPRAVIAQAKTSNYVSGVLATMEIENSASKHPEAQEAIMLDERGCVQEGRTNNIFIAKDGTVITPPAYGILDGVTRRAVIKLCLDYGFPLREKEITRHEVYTADEAFLTFTSGEIVPIRELDQRKVGTACPGLITQRLHALYQQTVKHYVRQKKQDGHERKVP